MELNELELEKSWFEEKYPNLIVTDLSLDELSNKIENNKSIIQNVIEFKYEDITITKPFGNFLKELNNNKILDDYVRFILDTKFKIDFKELDKNKEQPLLYLVTDMAYGGVGSSIYQFIRNYTHKDLNDEFFRVYKEDIKNKPEQRKQEIYDKYYDKSKIMLDTMLLSELKFDDNLNGSINKDKYNYYFMNNKDWLELNKMKEFLLDIKIFKENNNLKDKD